MKPVDITFKLPNLWTLSFLRVYIVLICFSIVIFYQKNTEVPILTAGLTFFSTLFLAIGRLQIDQKRNKKLIHSQAASESISSPKTQSKVFSATGLFLMIVGFGLMIINLMLKQTTPFAWVSALLVVILAFGIFYIPSIVGMFRSAVHASLLGSIALLTSIQLGQITTGLFPSILIAFFSFVAGTVHQINSVRISNQQEETEDKMWSESRRLLNRGSVFLFFFGVISIWPWLGNLYSITYFWILIIGVLTPLMYFWGRLRQPRMEHPALPLERLYRVLPYIGLILLLAFAAG